MIYSAKSVVLTVLFACRTVCVYGKRKPMNIHKNAEEFSKCCLVWFISWTLCHRTAREGEIQGLNVKDIERDREKAADEIRMQGL